MATGRLEIKISHSAVWICALALAGPFQKFAEASFCTDRHHLDTHSPFQHFILKRTDRQQILLDT